jgi:hypothetical protein
MPRRLSLERCLYFILRRLLTPQFQGTPFHSICRKVYFAEKLKQFSNFKDKVVKGEETGQQYA